jgi:hypothetical protein
VKDAGADKEIVARIFVAPNPDKAQVRAMAKFAIAAYLNVPVYAAFHEWLGRGPKLAGMWDAWKKGDRKAAIAAIPDEVVDELIVHGTPAECRAHISATSTRASTRRRSRSCRSASTRGRPVTRLSPLPPASPRAGGLRAARAADRARSVRLARRRTPRVARTLPSA